MCCEDLKMGRATRSSARTVALAAGNNACIAPSASRVAIILGSGSAATIGFAPFNMSAITDGIQRGTGQVPTVMTIQEYGDLVTKGWSIFTAAGQSVLVLEVFQTDMCNDPKYPV